MNDSGSEPKWIKWSKQLMAIAQNGLTYAENHFDRERYEQVRQVAAEMMAERSDTSHQKVLDLFAGEVGYATPKVDVRGAVFRDDQILLVSCHCCVLSFSHCSMSLRKTSSEPWPNNKTAFQFTPRASHRRRDVLRRF